MITIDTQVLITLVAVITALVTLYKYVTGVHDKTKKWDDQENNIAELHQSIEEYNLEQNAKIQQIQAEQYMQTLVLEAVLDGLHQLNCNGKVTKASDILHEHMNKQAHGVETE